MHVFCLCFFSFLLLIFWVTDVLLLWAASLIGIYIASLAPCHCVIVIVLCYLKLVWQINFLSLSLFLSLSASWEPEKVDYRQFKQSSRDARQHRCCYVGNQCTTCNKTKLEIWGRTQREAARRRKSDWGTVEGLQFLSQQLRGPSATALSYTCIASAMLNLGGSEWDNRTLLFVNQSLLFLVLSTCNRS